MKQLKTHGTAGRRLSSIVPLKAQKYANPFKSGVQLFLQAKELANLDHFSESDPFCSLYLRSSLTAEWKFIGKTETIDNNLNPKWVKHFHIEYQFDRPIYLKFEVWDEDKVDKAQFVGGISITIAEILTAPLWLFSKSLVCEGKFTGTLIIQADVVNVRDDTITFQIGGDLVSKKWLCWGSDNPYTLIERARTLNETGESLESFKLRSKGAIGEVVAPLSQVTDWVKIYKSDYRFGQRKPIWDCETIKMTTFCNNNKSLPFKISVYNYSNAGDHEIYGSCITSVREIEMGRKMLEIKSDRGLKGGTIIFKQINMNLKPSLLAYLKSGWKISCGVSIDFTLSNKPYNNPKSHHWQDDRERKEFAGEMNDYERAIFEIGSCLEAYTIDKKFHLMGFGGQPRYLEDKSENNKNSRCWNLNGKSKSKVADSKVDGTQGMLVNYLKALKGTTMMGPTYFADTFRRFIQIIQEESKENDQIYFIFVILTDGAIHDMKETCKLVIKMSYMPVSIIIVGIGEEDFSQMEILDADTKVLTDDLGRAAARDIIQFVKLNDMNELAKVEVEENILTEVPHHFVDYMILQQIKPMEELNNNVYLNTEEVLMTDRNLVTQNSD